MFASERVAAATKLTPEQVKESLTNYAVSFANTVTNYNAFYKMLEPDQKKFFLDTFIGALNDLRAKLDNPGGGEIKCEE